MGIRTKIVLGFILLTATVITIVSFWGAQSLGLTVDNSDYIHLDNIKNDILKQLSNQQSLLKKQVKETQKAIENIDLNVLYESQKLSNIILSIKENLDLDYAEIFEISKNLNNLWKLDNSIYQLNRLFDIGPYSHNGYIVASSIINQKKNIMLVIAKKPKFVLGMDKVFSIVDSKGILASNGFFNDYSKEKLKEIINSETTQQIKIKGKLYRLRSFDLNNTSKIIVGYSAQIAIIAQSEINSMMFKLALFEIIGFLILGYFWGKRIFSPINMLKQSIDKVSEGQWLEIPSTLTENSYEEINSVAKSFNQMINQLSLTKASLIKTEKELAAKDKMATLGRFSAGIAHEINNPLGTILMSAGMLKESINKNLPIDQEDINTIIEEVKRCRDIIDNLRTYTRKTKPNLIRLLLKDFLEKDIAFWISEYENTYNIKTSYNISSDTYISVDKKAMRQVFNNLIKNAIEASIDNKLIIEIRVEETDNDINIKILDNGKGFECNLDHIFEPMFTTKAQGTGLGLVICQAIIEGHNGKINAKRLEESNQTCFEIILPKSIKDSEGSF